jgi:hypothetical protein
MFTPANERDREQVAEMTYTVQEVTGGTVDVAFVSGLYRRFGPGAGAGLWRGAGSGQACRGQARLYSVVKALGRRTQLCLDGSLSPSGARLRTACRNSGRTAFRCLRLSDAQYDRHDDGTRFITQFRILQRQGTE